MVTTGPAPTRNTHPTAPLDLAYWVQFQRGDAHGGPAYTGTYGFDWVEWKRNSANNPHTAYDDLTAVMGKPIGDYVHCYDPGIPDIPAQPATATSPAIPLKPGIPPRYAAVSGMYKQRYEDELHKGYDKLIVQGNDYYVPWLSLRPRQTVQLKLEVEFLNKNPVQATNLFTVAAHPDYVVTINGKTNAAPMQLVPQNKQVFDVTIESLRPSAAARLRVEDEHKNLVGQLNIADNTLVYELPLRVVYVLKGIPMNPKDPVGTTPPRPLYARPGTLAKLQGDFEKLNFITYLNTQSLNQALITCAVTAPPSAPTPPPTPPRGSPPLAPAYVLLIDEDQWKADGYLRGGILQQPDQLPEYCEKLVVADPAIGPFNGITIFVHQLNRIPTKDGLAAASGSILPVGAKTLTVYQEGIRVGKKSTLAHELGHVLGLTHAFPTVEEESPVPAYPPTIAAVQKAIQDTVAEIAALQKAAQTPPTPAEQAAIAAKQQVLAQAQVRLRDLQARALMYQRNPFKFTRFSTENLMDYDKDEFTDNRRSFWHWQWAVLQADVAAYYGTTTTAK